MCRAVAIGFRQGYLHVSNLKQDHHRLEIQEEDASRGQARCGRQLFCIDTSFVGIRRFSNRKSTVVAWAFSPLVHTCDEGRLAHLRDCLSEFREPYKVVSNYAGELAHEESFKGDEASTVGAFLRKLKAPYAGGLGR